jgi:uncharacterized Zn finger protein
MGLLTCPCPQCQTQTVPWLEPEVRLLEATSKDALVNYYRCDSCGCVWTVPKSDPDAPPQTLTVRTRPTVQDRIEVARARSRCVVKE